MTGATIAEKILAAHSGKNKVSPGEFLSVRVDLVMANDITAPIAITEFKRIGVTKVFDPQRVVMVADHFVPNKDIPSAEQAKLMREFAREQGVVYFEVGSGGIEHVLLPEKGLVLTGMGSTDIACAMATGEVWMKVPPTIKLVYHGRARQWVSGKDLILYTIGDIGVDGARYAAMEFCGEAIDSLSMDSRFTVANMAIEAGAKVGIFRVDNKTRAYINDRASRSYKLYEPDKDAHYEKVIEYDVSQIEPQVAFPHLPSNTKPLSEVGEVRINQAVIGSCTNGRIEDLQIAAEVLKWRKVHPEVRLIVIPGTQEVSLEAMRRGLIEIFIRAGAAVSTPTCGPCLGGYMGVLAAGEKCISATCTLIVSFSQPYSANSSGPPIRPSMALAAATAGLER